MMKTDQQRLMTAGFAVRSSSSQFSHSSFRRKPESTDLLIRLDSGFRRNDGPSYEPPGKRTRLRSIDARFGFPANPIDNTNSACSNSTTR